MQSKIQAFNPATPPGGLAKCHELIFRANFRTDPTSDMLLTRAAHLENKSPQVARKEKRTAAKRKKDSSKIQRHSTYTGRPN